MKRRMLACVLLIAILLGGCAENNEVRLGVYMGSDPHDFPFPTSGYTVYFVGESHGNHETKLIFQSYLKRLYKEAGLRDVILEEDQAYETEANAYVRGSSDRVPHGLCLRSDILGQIRDFNQTLPDPEKVTVHLVDVDSPFPILYKHLTELHSQIGPEGESVPLPDLSDVKYAKSEILYDLIDELRAISADRPDVLNGLDTVRLSLEWYYLGNQVDTGWPIGIRSQYAPIREDVITKNVKYAKSEILYDLIDELRAISADRPDVLNGLDTVRLSLEWYYLGNQLDIGQPMGSRSQFAPIREDVITKNVKHVLSQVNGRPVMAFFGLFHGMKIQADPNPPVKGFKSWGQRLTEENVPVYSLAIFGRSGTSFWRGESLSSDEEFLKDFKLTDDTTLLSLFDSHADSSIVYTDLRTEDNSTITLSSELLDIPVSQLFDGIIIFREFTPMENACPQ